MVTYTWLYRHTFGHSTSHTYMESSVPSHTQRHQWPWPMHYGETGMHAQDMHTTTTDTVPKDGHMQIQPASWWFSHSHTHFRNGYICKVSISVHITQLYVTGRIASPNVLYPVVPCHTITEKHSPLHENAQVTQTSMWPHTIIAPCGQTQYLTHGEVSIQFPFHTHEHSQVYTQKDSGPDITLRAVFTPKTRFLIELCTQSGDKPPCYITQIQTLVVQPAHGNTHTHTHQPHSHRQTLTDYDTGTSTYSH